MKYHTQIEIDLPRAKTVELMDNIDNMKHWQEGLKSAEVLEGVPGKEGAKTKLVYQMGKRRIEMVETITKNAFPKEFHAIYEAKGVWNEVKNVFTETGDGTTIWDSSNTFKCSGAMKIMAFLMPGAFKKQSQKYMVDFKNWAEKTAKK